MREVWSETSPQSLLASNGSNLWAGETVNWEWHFHSPASSIHFIINHHLRTSTVLVVVGVILWHYPKKLREFLRLSGSLLDAVGWIRPSMEIFLGLALNKKGAQWSMSCGLLVLQSEACRLPLQMGPEGTHTNWPAEPLSNTIPSLLSQQLLYRTTLQHH